MLPPADRTPDIQDLQILIVPANQIRYTGSYRYNINFNAVVQGTCSEGKRCRSCASPVSLILVNVSLKDNSPFG